MSLLPAPSLALSRSSPPAVGRRPRRRAPYRCHCHCHWSTASSKFSYLVTPPGPASAAIAATSAAATVTTTVAAGNASSQQHSVSIGVESSSSQLLLRPLSQPLPQLDFAPQRSRATQCEPAGCAHLAACGANSGCCRDGRSGGAAPDAMPTPSSSVHVQWRCSCSCSYFLPLMLLDRSRILIHCSPHPSYRFESPSHSSPVQILELVLSA